ncbi:MAG: hypothetical protein WEE66_11120 [Actinomycetota bacterium]
MDFKAMEAAVSWYRQLSIADDSISAAIAVINPKLEGDWTSVRRVEWHALADAARSLGKASALAEPQSDPSLQELSLKCIAISSAIANAADRLAELEEDDGPEAMSPERVSTMRVPFCRRRVKTEHFSPVEN